MYRWQYLLLVAALAFAWPLTQQTLAADDDPIPSSDMMPTRVPLLDESSLDRFGQPQMGEPSEATIDQEFPSDTLIPIDTKNLRYFSYLTKINNKIDQSYYYPTEAAKDFLGGIVSVSMEIERSGRLGEVKVLEPSGKKVLDDAAVTIINKAAPFPPVPSRILNTPLKVSTDIRFVPTQEAVQRQEGLGIPIQLK